MSNYNTINDVLSEKKYKRMRKALKNSRKKREGKEEYLPGTKTEGQVERKEGKREREKERERKREKRRRERERER